MKRIILILIVSLPLLALAQKKSKDVTHLLNNAKVLYDKGQVDEAIALVKTRKRTLEQVDGGKLLYHKLLGQYYAALSQYENLEKESYIILSDTLLNASESDKAEAYFQIATICLSRNDIRKAEESFQRSLQIQKKFGNENNPYVRSTLSGLGTTYYYLKDYAKANQYFTTAKYLYEKNLDFSLEYVKCLNNYALVLNEQKEFFWAKCMIDVARNTLRQLPSAHNLESIVMPILSSMSTIYADMGYNDESLQIIQEGLSLCKDHNSMQATLLYNNLAVHAISRKDYKTSIYILTQCLPLAVAAQKNEILFNLAYVRWLTKDQEASATIRDLSESIINDVCSKFCFLSNSEREQYWKYYNPYIQILNSWLVQANDVKNNARLYDNALFSKGLLLRTSNRIRERIVTSGNKEVEKQYDELVFLLKNKDSLTLDRDSAMQVRERINTIDKNLTQFVQGYVSLSDIRREYDWHSVKKSLGSDECAIEFLMIPSWNGDSICADPDYYAAIVRNSSDSPTLVRLSKESEISSILSRSKSLPLNRYISNLYKWGSRTQGERIYKSIWEPIEPYLQGVRNVYLSPVGLLNNVSFNAIALDSMYMGQKYNLFRLTSTSQVKHVKENNKRFALSSAIVYGGVRYDAMDSELFAASRSYTKDELHDWNATDEDYKPARSGWQYLPGTKIEAESICTRLDSAGIHATLISGANANEESFKHKAHGHDLIHIATHGFFLTDKREIALNSFLQGHRSPDAQPSAMIRSGLLFSGANRAWTGNGVIRGIEDGILTAEEISNVNLSGTRLVVLSACETGLGEIKSSEGVFGLQRAFKLAGAESLIMSLWKVDDHATMQLMDAFYSNWISGMSKHEAFNNAIEQIRRRYRSPYYWAAFVMLD